MAAIEFNHIRFREFHFKAPAVAIPFESDSAEPPGDETGVYNSMPVLLPSSGNPNRHVCPPKQLGHQAQIPQ